MSERPILFSAPLVRALLEGRKTQTRRVITKQNSVIGVPGVHWEELDWMDARPDPGIAPGSGYCHVGFDREGERLYTRVYPRVELGDLLWVREAWCPSPDGIIYRATEQEHGITAPDDYNIWKPSIFMPREHSRLSMRVTAVRCERLQDISEIDARAEGITGPHECGYIAYKIPGDSKPRYGTVTSAYESIWDSINGKTHPWDSNPWVWVYEWAPLTPKDRQP